MVGYSAVNRKMGFRIPRWEPEIILPINIKVSITNPTLNKEPLVGRLLKGEIK